MFVLQKTKYFAEWLSSLRDSKAKAKILVRLTRMELGNLGDHKSIGNGLSEIRIDYGPGYRLYYTKNGNTILILLVGGDKSSQQKDIERAKMILYEMENNI